MTENESADPVELERMDRLVNRARGAMNLLLITAAVVIWGGWDTEATRFTSFHYTRLLNLLEQPADLTPVADFDSLFLPEAREAAKRVLVKADEAYAEAKNSGDHEQANKLLDASIQLGRSKNRMDESREQQLTVGAFQSLPLEVLGIRVHPADAGGLVSLAATGLLLYLICLVRTMRRYPVDGSDWIFHLDGTLPVLLGGCWLLLPAAAVTVANGQLLWELLTSGILLIDPSPSLLFMLVQLVVGILAPLLLGVLATLCAWKTRENRCVIANKYLVS